MFTFLKYYFLLFIGLGFAIISKAQLLSFRHLGIEEGLPSNVSSHACFDSTGLLWVATNDGLLNYDGTRIKQYLKETHPGLPINDIAYLFCDSRNRIWICTNEGLALMDEQRRIKSIIINDTIKNKDVNYCFEVAGLGIVATGSQNSYLLPENKTQWIPYSWFDETIRKKKRITGLKKFSKESYLFISESKVMLVNFRTQKIISSIVIANASTVSKLNNRELLVADADSFKLYKVDINTNTITKKYTGIKDAEGNRIDVPITSHELAANGVAYIATLSGGLIGFDVFNEKFYSYHHQPLNRSSISGDNLRRVFCHSNGYMMITSSNGVNYTNVLTPMLQQLNNFIDDKGKITDGVSAAAQDAEGRIWFRSYDNLLIWNRKTNAIKNISPPQVLAASTETNPGLGGIYRDNKNNMWVAYGGKGLFKFDGNGKLLNYLTHQKKQLPTNRIRFLRQLTNNILLAATDDGLFMLNPESFAIDTLADHPLLKPLLKKRILEIFTDGDDVWIAVSPNGAAYCYNFNTKKLRTIGVKDGLSSDRVYCFGKDFNKNIYIGTYDGITAVSPDGKLNFINKQNGLRHTRVENIVTDKQGRLWITNFNCLIRYNPSDKSFAYFDEQNGVSNAGFSVAQNISTNDGKIIFCNAGLLIANTTIDIIHKKFVPQININRLYDDGGYDLLQPSSTIKLKYDDAKISLYYLTNTLITANRFFYRYKMDELDTGWQQPTKNNQVTYNLNPGKYTFHIQASSVEGIWGQTENTITIIVSPPWWQTWWARIIAITLLTSAIYFIIKRRIKAIKTKATIRQQMAELEGKALRTQMNPHFIFNSLNAIQELIVSENYKSSYQYLSRFSKLLRMVLNNSEKNFIPLSSEIEVNQLYLELESLRFKQSFYYNVTVDENTDADSIMFPSLLLQPFIENAIWHGLMHKQGEKRLNVSFTTANNILSCVIEDNGIGRNKAGEIKAQKLGAHHFASKGTELAQHRVEVMRQSGTAIDIETIDNYNDAGTAAGTTVQIKIPFQKINS